jgi:hypothetical protein
MIQYVVTNSLSIELNHITYTSLLQSLLTKLAKAVKDQVPAALTTLHNTERKQVNGFQILWPYNSTGHQFTLNVSGKSFTYCFSQLSDMERLGLSLWISSKTHTACYIHCI